MYFGMGINIGHLGVHKVLPFKAMQPGKMKQKKIYILEFVFVNSRNLMTLATRDVISSIN